MLLKNITFNTAVLFLAMLGSANVFAQSAENAPSNAELWKIVKQQQQAIKDLTAQLKQQNGKIEATGEILDKVSQDANKTSSFSTNTRIGGYGELHYNNLDSKEEIDFHRFVLFFGHQFNERLRFFSELEIEHALSGDGQPGEVELEQAYIEYDINDHNSVKGGVFLMPVGILNETHEPNTFYGVERNPVEKNIIPTTWWEAGAALSGHTDNGWSYDLAATSGLEVPTTGGSAYKVRSGRQKSAKANANNGALTARLKWTGWQGVELGATMHYQDDLTQASGAMGSNSSATLLETHAAINRGKFGLRALYARWDLNGSGAKAIGRDVQDGWYIEPSYKLMSNLGVFARYNSWDNEAGNSANTEIHQTDIGVNFWPHENVVLKADIMSQSGNANDDGFNVGIGYMF